MSLPKAELDAIVAELQPLEGAKIQRITQPSLDEFILQVRAPGQTHLLYMNLSPPHERLHLIPERPRSLPSPTAFCMALRKQLIGARIATLSILPNDRILQLHLLHKEDAHTLWLELLPRRANLLLFDSEGGFRQAYQQVSTTRHMRRGDTYIPPEAPVHKGPPKSAIERPACTEEEPFPLNVSVAAKYAGHADEQRFTREKQIALKTRRNERKKRQRLAQNLARDAERCEAALAREQDGELLKSVMHQIKRGAESVEVVDYYDPAMPTRQLQLDPAISPQANLDRLFHKLKRARKGLANIAPRLEAIEYRLLELDEELEAITAAETWDLLSPFVDASDDKPRGQQKSRKQSGKALPYHEFQSVDGKRILVGRNSRGNDELTFRVARGNDLWLHVRGIPGSHVVVPMQKGAEASSELQIDAATLAAHFSKARGEKHVDVMITPARYVRKQKGAPPGQVSVIRDNNIALRVEDLRLQRLLGKEEILGGVNN